MPRTTLYGIRLILGVMLLAITGSVFAATSAPHKVYLPKVHRAIVTQPAAGPKVYFGGLIKGETYGKADAPWDMTTVDRFETNAGKKISILHWGQPWYWGTHGGYQAFQTDLYEKLRVRGIIPMINWNSWDLDKGSNPDQPNFQLADIINGQHDAYIRQWARDAKAWGYPFMVRFDHEMNGTWYPWSERKNGNAPGQYIGAWRHVVDIFRQEGATNATWIWAANGVYSTAIPLKDVYPGDSYVDWVGIDSYNWGTNPAKPNNVWKSFSDTFKPTYDALQQLAPSKPIIIAETASSEYGGSKAAWIKDGLQTQLPQAFPKIKAFMWFNWNDRATYADMDWVIESSSGAQSAFKSGISSGYYASNSFGNLPKLSKVKPLP